MRNWSMLGCHLSGSASCHGYAFTFIRASGSSTSLISDPSSPQCLGEISDARPSGEEYEIRYNEFVAINERQTSSVNSNRLLVIPAGPQGGYGERTGFRDS